jgi:hypothetical protein
VQEVHREYPSLGVQELPARRARAARRRIDPRGAEDLIDGRRADGNSQLRQFTVDLAVSPRRFSFASRTACGVPEVCLFCELQ